MKTIITVYFFVVCTIIGPCVSLKCYKCIGGSDCADPFNASSAWVADCPSVGGSTPMCSVFEDKTTGSFTRDCATAKQCTSDGCLSTSGGTDFCSYCCDSDRCNSGSVADAVADVLHCYYCTWTSYDGYSACSNPSDTNREGVMVAPCNNECGISRIDIPYDGSAGIVRGCFNPPCKPGCDSQGTCTTCCSENLCNGGPGATRPQDTKS